ncbi:MAG: hypothetical protein ABH863_02085 [Candidatus Micrarchaeota archaeon]
MGLLTSDLRRFYLSIGLWHFGLALISLFVPAYLYFELRFSILQVLLFFLLQETLTILLIPISGNFISKFGTRRAMLLAVPFSLLTYFFIPLAASYPYLFAAAFFRACFASFYYLSFHVYLGTRSISGKTGEATGKAWSIARLALLTAPLVGGLLLQFVGYAAAFALLVLFQFLSVWTLPKEGARQVFSKPVLSTATKAELLAWSSQGMTIEGNSFVWPLYAFILLGSYASLGALSFAAGLFVALFSLWLGGSTDKFGQGRMLPFGYGLASISWFFRSVVGGFLGVFGGNFLGEAAFVGMEAPIMSKIYSETKSGGNLLGKVMVREIALRLGAFPLILLLAFLSFQTVFALMGAFYLLLALSGVVRKPEVGMNGGAAK